jgi:hypothetical protein
MTGVNGDAPATRPLWFDAATGGEALPARWTVEDIARSLSPSAEWTLESLPSGTAPLVLRPRLDDDRLILGARLGDRSVEITLTPDVSGWVRVTAAFNGSSAFCAFLDRPYEEFELWPPGSDIGPGASPRPLAASASA